MMVSKRKTQLYIQSWNRHWKEEIESQRWCVFEGFNPVAGKPPSPRLHSSSSAFQTRSAAVVWPRAKLFNKQSAPSLPLSPAPTHEQRDKARIFPSRSWNRGRVGTRAPGNLNKSKYKNAIASFSAFFQAYNALRPLY
jgi:hypothetical protein